MPPDPNDNSLLRNIGQFVGHIAHAIKTDPPPAAPTDSPRVVRTRTEQHITPDGTLVLRRTIIDEIEARPGSADSSFTPPSSK